VTADAPATLPADPVLRPRYREDQWLGSDDLRDEQAYRLRLRRLHELGAHRWGIVEGLEVTDRTTGLILGQGTAVDGYGRVLVVSEPVDIPGSVFDRLDADQVDAWLLHGREPATPQQGGSSWPCGPGRNSRWLEEAVLRLTRTGSQADDPRRPPGVPEPDRCFSPYRPPPDDPGRRWPVYLGRLRRTPGSNPPYTSDTSSRPYAGLVGAAVTAPSGRSVLHLGGERRGDLRRFAVITTAPPPPPAATATPPAATATTPPPMVDRLVVDSQGRTRVPGAGSVAGAMQLPARAAPAAGAGGGGRGSDLPAARRLILRGTAAAAAAAPWTLTHVDPQPPDRSPRELRVELTAPPEDGDPSLYRMQVGRTDEHGRFVPCLTVDAGCKVTVHGQLVVKGQLVEAPVQADPADPRFAAALVGQWADGLTSASRQVDLVYAADLKVGIQPGPQPRPGDSFPYTVIAQNPGRGPATDVAVYETLAVGGTVVRQRKVDDKVRLDAGTAARYQLTYDVPQGTAGERLTMAVSAIGLGPVNNYLTARSEAAVDIQVVIN
jgi:uncharacterized repeat protein (TIGR01451 family)